MPELPEVEHLRRSLEPHLVGARITAVRVRRRDMVRVAGTRKALHGVKPTMLLEGDRIVQLIRRGKSLAIVGEAGGVLGVHLGMTGMMRVVGEAQQTECAPDKHVHCAWTLVRDREAAPHHSNAHGGLGASHARFVRKIGGSTQISNGNVASPDQSFALWFRDPRRFGGLYPFDSMEDLLTHRGGWARLGPDALEIDPQTLRARLLRTSMPIKAALLNQALIAGVGNIYADESLFAAGIHPNARPRGLASEQWRCLAESIVRILRTAINAGGSSISDYVDAEGEAGTYGGEHRVYGRAGLPCEECGRLLLACIVGQRTTVFCEGCQTKGGRRSGVARSGRGRRANHVIMRCPQDVAVRARGRSRPRPVVV